MSANPYEAPQSVLDDTSAQAAPPLWNPNAAANWSLPFTPIFGAVLHMKNWQALGEPAKAAASRNWAIGSAAIIFATVLIGAFMEDDKASDGIARLLSFILLLTWYFASARAQAKYIKERFGPDYPRKGWGKPLLFAVLAVFAFFIVMFVVGFVLALFGRLSS